MSTGDTQSIADDGGFPVEWGPFEVTRQRFDGPITGEMDVHEGRFITEGKAHLLEHWKPRLEKVRRRMNTEGEALRRRVQGAGLFNKISEWRLDPTEGWRLRRSWEGVGSDRRRVTELIDPVPSVRGWADLPEGFHYAGGRALIKLVHDGDDTHWFGERRDGEGFPVHVAQGPLRRVVREMRNDNYENWGNL